MSINLAEFKIQEALRVVKARGVDPARVEEVLKQIEDLTEIQGRVFLNVCQKIHYLRKGGAG